MAQPSRAAHKGERFDWSPLGASAVATGQTVVEEGTGQAGQTVAEEGTGQAGAQTQQQKRILSCRSKKEPRVVSDSSS